MSYRCDLCLVVNGLLGISLLILNIDASVYFIQNPATPLYVVKGQTAKFVWTYSFGNKYKEFKTFSPEWFYKGHNQSLKVIGHDIRQIGWRFELTTATCPPRLLSPTIRVSRKDQATLVITNVTTADDGVYGCILDLRSGNDKTSTTTLKVTETPTFTTRPNTKTIITEHSDLNIMCTAVGHPTPNVTWIQSVTKKTLAKGVGNAILRISNVIRSQSGIEYECQAINNPIQGPVKAKTKVIVHLETPTIDTSSQQESSRQESKGGMVAAAVCASFLVISLIVNILLVVYIYRNKTTSKKTTDSGYNDVRVEMATVPSLVQTAQTSQSIAEYEAVEQPHAKPAVPIEPDIYEEIPESPQTSQDHYQQLNPKTIKHDPIVHYDQRNDTYQPLSNRATEYQNLQFNSNKKNSSLG